MKSVVKSSTNMARARAARTFDRRRTPLDVIREKPSSLRAAVNAKCYDCEGGDADPCVQWRIGNCVMDECPLFNVRPYQKMRGRPVPPSLAGTWGL